MQVKNFFGKNVLMVIATDDTVLAIATIRIGRLAPLLRELMFGSLIYTPE
jgi:hypothetical protein